MAKVYACVRVLGMPDSCQFEVTQVVEDQKTAEKWVTARTNEKDGDWGRMQLTVPFKKKRVKKSK